MSITITQEYFNVAENFEKNGFYKEAIESYEKAKEADPSFLNAYFNLALIYHRNKQFEDAISNLEKLIELDPCNAIAFNNLGVLYFSISKLEEAKKSFEKALSIEGNYPEARTNLKKVYENLQKTAQCLQYKQSYTFTFQTTDPGLDGLRTFGDNQTVTSDNNNVLQNFAHCSVDTQHIQNIINSRVKHLMEFTDTSLDQFKQKLEDAGKIVEEEWKQHIISKRPIKEFYSRVSKDVIFTYASPDSNIGSHWRLEYIVRLLTPFVSHNCKFLDFGAGIGETGIYFSKKCRVTLFDVPGHTQEFAKFHANKLGADICFLNNLEEIKENTFDLISAQDVLEHIENPMDTVERLYNALKKGGYFITSGFWFNPNAHGHLASNIRYRETWLDDFVKMGLKYIGWLCGQNWTIAIFQKTHSDMVINEALPISSNTSSKASLNLLLKDYTECQLVRKDDGRQFIRRDNNEEPFVVHLVGARWSNHPWGMENELHRALEKLGITIIDTDFRRDHNRLPELFQQEAHVMLVIKGNGIPPELIKRLPCKTILWYQDDIFTTEHASKQITYNGWAFDMVYSFDKMAIDLYRELGVKDPRWLPLAMSPTVHRKTFLTEKKYDISFVGNIYPNRKILLERLARRFNLFVTQAFMDDMVRIFNESKIVLNLGIGPTGIQQRVFEVMGCGSFLLTNEIPQESRLFKDRVHLVYFNDTNIEELAEYYLSHDEEREAIALAGYREVNNGHTFLHRIQKILDDTFCNKGLSVQTAIDIKHTDYSCNTHNSLVPTLSVIVPTYNRKSFLDQCINSLLKNSEQNIEIIVVDDPCTDGTREWLDEIKMKFENIVVIHNQTHEGAQRSMNIGFKTAKGQYIGFINDDIEVTKNWDSPLIALLQSNPCYGTATHLILDKDGYIHSMGLIEGVLSRKYPQLGIIPGMRGFFPKGTKLDQIPESRYVREVEYGYYWFMKREVWEKIGGIDESLGKYCVDPDFGMRVRLAGYKNMYCPTSVIIDHGLYIRPESAKVDLKKSQKIFVEKWDAYVDSTNLISHENKIHKILIVAAIDNKKLKQEVITAIDQLSKQHTTAFIVSNDLTAKMDVDVMNHLLIEGASTFQPDILLILGGKDIYPRILRKLKKTLSLTIMLWWHPDMDDNTDEMPEWAVKLNGETDVCFITGATLDYIRTAETKGMQRGFHLDSKANIADEISSILKGDIKDRILLYHGEIQQLANGCSEQDVLNISEFLFEKGMGTIATPYLEKVIQNNQNNLDAYLLLCDLFFKQGDMEMAKKVLQRASNVPLLLFPIYNRLGKAYLKLGDANEAEKWFRNAIEQPCYDSDLYSNLGNVLIQKGNLIEAEKFLKLHLEKYPDSVHERLYLGKLYRNLNRIDDAISCFHECLRIDSNRDYEDEVRENLEYLYSVKEMKYDTSSIQMSIYILTYNRAEYMKRSLYLFNRQTLPHRAFEIIILDSSTDNTREIIQDAVKQYGLNIRYFFVAKEGPGANAKWFNFAVKQAKGDVILWTQPEILFSEKMLEEFYKPHILEEKLWVSGRMGVVLTKEDQGKVDLVWNSNVEEILSKCPYIRKEMYRLGYKFWLPLLVSFRKDTFLRIGGFIEGLPVPRHDDLDLMFRLLAIGYSIHNPPDFQGIHQWHPPFEEHSKELVSLSDMVRQSIYEQRRKFLRGEVSAENYAIRNKGKEIGIDPNIKEVPIIT